MGNGKKGSTKEKKERKYQGVKEEGKDQSWSTGISAQNAPKTNALECTVKHRTLPSVQKNQGKKKKGSVKRISLCLGDIQLFPLEHAASARLAARIFLALVLFVVVADGSPAATRAALGVIFSHVFLLVDPAGGG